VVSPICFSTINDFGLRYSFQTSSEVFPNEEKEVIEVMAMGLFNFLFYLIAKVAKFYFITQRYKEKKMKLHGD
jgi:hypothetical protein